MELGTLLLFLTLFSDGDLQVLQPGDENSAELVVNDCRLVFPQKQMVAASQGGILKSRLKEGQSVSRGDISASMQDEIIAARVAVSRHRASDETRIRRARETLASAKRERQLAERGNEEVTNTYPESEVYRRRSAETLATLELAIEESQLKLLQLQLLEEESALASLKLQSRIDGIVTRTFKNPGEGVAGGEDVLEIVNTDFVRVEGYVKLKDARKLKVSQKALVIVVFEDSHNSSTPDVRHFNGQLTFVDVVVQPLSGAVRIWVEVDNRPCQLAEGMSATMKLKLSH